MNKTHYSKHYRKKGLSTRKLFALASVTFASAIAVSATSTYAWYAITEKFHIVGLKMTIDHDNLTFRLGKKDGGVIHYQEDEPYSLKDFGYEDPTLGNISNMFHDEYPSSYDPTFNPYFYTGYRPGGPVTKTTVTDDRFEGGFVQLEFFLEVSQDALIYLTPSSKATPAREANAETAREKGLNADDLDRVTEASRISFYSEYGYVVAELGETHEQVDYAGELDLFGDGYFDADSSGKETLFGQYSGTPSYGEPLQEDEHVPFGVKQDIFHAAHKAGNRKINAGSYTAKQEIAHPLSYYAFEDGYGGAHPVAVAKAGKENRLVVSVYLEGWDHDMTSSLIYASFGFDLGFIAVFDPAASDTQYKLY